MQWTTAIAVLVLACTSGVAAADDAKSKQERAGTCADAKSQMSYFCDPSPNGVDMLTQFGACDNAKKNVKLACEGIDEGDKAYKFDK